MSMPLGKRQLVVIRLLFVNESNYSDFQKAVIERNTTQCGYVRELIMNDIERRRHEYANRSNAADA